MATLATVFSIILGADLTTFHQLLLGASAMSAASIASAILGTIMIGVIISSHYFRVNPDNIATPIAASLGDLVTLGLLSLLAQGFYNSGREWAWHRVRGSWVFPLQDMLCQWPFLLPPQGKYSMRRLMEVTALMSLWKV